MKIFLETLMQEHTLITEVFSKLERYFLRDSDFSAEFVEIFENFIFFIEDYVEGFHHKKEEEVLFPKINLSPIVYQGGPFCTHFYYFHMEYQRCNQSRELAQEIGLVLHEPQRSERVTQIVRNKTALLVPLEDHWTCQVYIQIFKSFLAKMIESKDLDPILFRRSLVAYFGLMAQHTEKENHCLFVMCDELLDDSIQRAMQEEAYETIGYNESRTLVFKERVFRLVDA